MHEEMYGLRRQGRGGRDQVGDKLMLWGLSIVGRDMVTEGRG